MPSTQDAGSLPSTLPPPFPPAEATASPAQQLALASRALWVATLSLMTAYMQNAAPAHRLLLARRIARNFDTLARQECFAAGCRASFERLARRWQVRADQLAPEAAAPRRGLIASFF
ncbi:hypothetical protein [Ramlibacter sp. AN1133]|uniref:hypothetical protein n=1 Tax=Ramlibacter sp. AN1133 TaxID=3133429 RepID=UPI0030C1506D